MTFGQRTFSHLANLVLSTPGKVIVLVTATALLGGGIYGTTQLRQVLHSLAHVDSRGNLLYIFICPGDMLMLHMFIPVSFLTPVCQEFDATWFLPPTSYLRQWFAANDQHFPSTGERYNWPTL